MHAPTISRRSQSLMAALVVACISFSTAGALAGEGPNLTPDVPKLAPIVQPPKTDYKKPLQATIEKSEKFDQPKQKPFSGRLRTGAQAAEQARLRAKLQEQQRQLQAQAAQQYAGVGIIGVKFVLTMGKPPVINRVFPGTPAADVGLHINDTIVAVDGVPTYGLTKEEVYDLIIGSPGSPVTVSIMRGSDFQVVKCTRMDVNEITDPLVRRDYLISM